MYLLEIGTIPLLSKAEELRLGRAIQQGREAAAALTVGVQQSKLDEERLRAMIDDGRMAVQRFVSSNLPLVVFVAKRYRSSGVPLLDLIQEGNLGLIRAAQKYDVRRGVRFSTHATWWIRQAIQAAVARDSRTIHLPQRVSHRLAQLYGVESRLQMELGRRPTADEIGQEMGVDADEIRKLRALPGRPRSLNECVGADEEAELGDLIAATTPSPDVVAALAADIAGLLSVLDQREREMLTLRFGLNGHRPCTFKELGKLFDVTPERARQIHVAAMAKLAEAASP